MNIKIIVATHKMFWMPEDEVYLPIQVGAEGKADFGYTPDNIGDNISYKNPNYCELTGLYWAWKNLNVDYIGLCHYRRYFGHEGLSNESIEEKKRRILAGSDYSKILNEYDVLLPEKMLLGRHFTVKKQYEECHNLNDIMAVREILRKDLPSYINAFETILNKHSFYCFNMFAMRKKYFDQYCEWLFDVLFKLESQLQIEYYDSYQKRVFGFLSERLFNVWLLKQNLSIKEMPIVFLENENQPKEGNMKRLLKYKVYNILNW